MTKPEAPEPGMCQPDGLKFDAFGEPRTRYVRVTLRGDHCVMRPSEGDSYVEDARNCWRPGLGSLRRARRVAKRARV